MDFLAATDDIARRTKKRLETILRKANIKTPKTLEEFDLSLNPGVNRSLIQDLATHRIIEEKVFTFIIGAWATGKSPICHVKSHSVIRNGSAVLFITISKMHCQFNAARINNGFDKQFAKFASATLLIIGDFSLKPLKGFQGEAFHDVATKRY